nr:recombinase family protein [Streptomyces abyssomicinicus]
MSTEDHQDPATSRAWQLMGAQALVSGHGRIVAEYFDVGRSRTVSWARRPEASALLVTLADPEREFDAVVIGSSERAFYGNQFASMAPLFEHYGVEVWVPELGGAVDPKVAGQEELMILLGILSKREIARARIRTRAAMTVQAREPGPLPRRPPALRLPAVGRRPAPEPGSRPPRRVRAGLGGAPRVRSCRVVDFRPAAGRAQHMARITRALNDASIPCPAAADAARNPHRTGRRWVLHSVRAILANPRYTGRQVWNRQRTDHDLTRPPGRHPVEHPRRLDHLHPPRTPRARQRGRLHRRPADPHPPAAHTGPDLPAGRSAVLRHLRTPHGITLGSPAPRLPVPPRTHQQHSSRP